MTTEQADREMAERQFRQLDRIQREQGIRIRRLGKEPMDDIYYSQRAKTIEQLAKKLGLAPGAAAPRTFARYEDLFPTDGCD